MFVRLFGKNARMNGDHPVSIDNSCKRIRSRNDRLRSDFIHLALRIELRRKLSRLERY